MLKNMTLEERLQRIDDFFHSLSNDEFEKICYDCGAGVIKDSSISSYNFPIDDFPKETYVNTMSKKSFGEDCLSDFEEKYRGAA